MTHLFNIDQSIGRYDFSQDISKIRQEIKVLKNLKLQVESLFPSQAYHDVQKYLREEDDSSKKSLESEYTYLQIQISQLKSRLQNKQDDLQKHLEQEKTNASKYEIRQRLQNNESPLYPLHPQIEPQRQNASNQYLQSASFTKEPVDDQKDPETINVKPKRFIILYENSGSGTLEKLRPHFETSLLRLISELDPTETTLGILQGEIVIWNRNVQKSDFYLPNQNKKGYFFKTKPKLEKVFNQILKEVNQTRKEHEVEIILVMKGIKLEEIEKLKLPYLNTLVHILGVGAQHVSSFSLLSKKLNKTDHNSQTGNDYFEAVSNLQEITQACKNLKENMYLSQQQTYS